MSGLLMERLRFAKGIDPVANAFAATVYSDVYNMEDQARGLFVVYVGVGATGTSTFTIQACDDVTPTTTSAVPFYYREILTGDTEGAITAATSAGFTHTAGSSRIILCEVRSDALAASGYGFVRLKSVEVSAVASLGGILFIGEAKNPSTLKPTAIV